MTRSIPGTRFEIDGAVLTIANRLPIALAEPDDSPAKWITWPDAPLPDLGWDVRWFQAPNAIWVVYTESDVADFDYTGCSTAVRIDAASAVGFDLGSDVPIGADSIGLWLAQVEPVTGNAAQYGASVPAEVPDPADLPMERKEDLPKPEPLVLTPGAWQPEVLPTEPDPTWPPSASSALRRVRADGGEDHLPIDRTVVEAKEDTDGQLHLRYYAVRPGTATGGPGRVLYWERSISLPVTRLPKRVRVDEHHSIDHGLRDFMAEILRQQHPELQTLQPDRTVATSWTPRRPAESVQTAIAEWTLEELRAMAGDRVMMLRGDDQWHRVPSEYQQLTVETNGVWPTVQVTAEFTYVHHRLHSASEAPDSIAFRVIVDLYDEAGLPDVPRYLTVYIQEDIDTQRPEYYEFAEGGRRVLRY